MALNKIIFWLKWKRIEISVITTYMSNSVITETDLWWILPLSADKINNISSSSLIRDDDDDDDDEAALDFSFCCHVPALSPLPPLLPPWNCCDCDWAGCGGWWYLYLRYDRPRPGELNVTDRTPVKVPMNMYVCICSYKDDNDDVMVKDINNKSNNIIHVWNIYIQCYFENEYKN